MLTSRAYEKKVFVRIRKGKKGLELTLFDLEATVMDAVWAASFERFTVSDVLAILTRKREIAYTTVMTTLARLHDKGVLRRERDGKRYLYSPRFSRAEYLQATARDVLRGIAGSSKQGAMALLVDTVSEADESLLDDLDRMIRQRRKDLRS